MYILMIARGFPTKEDPQWGCFEKDQAEALVAYGHKVVVMSIDARYKRHRGSLGLHQFECNGVEYYNYVILPGIFFFKIVGMDVYRKKIKYHYYEKIYDIIEKKHGRPDVIYSHFFFNTIAGVLLKSRLRLPLVAIEHLGRFNQNTLTKETAEGAKFAYNGVDVLIAVAGTLSKNLEKHFGISCKVVHNMYGSEFSYNDDKSVSNIEQLIFVSAASIVYGKGFDVLIRAFAKAKLPMHSWKLNIIGWGEEKENLEKFVQEKNLQNNISFLGRMGKSDIANELKRSNIFVLPSRNENFSVAILEGLASGLPVLATDCGGIRECIDEKNGIIVPVDDVDAMAAAIKRMIETYSQYDRNYIAKDCKKRFSPEAIAGQLTDVFETVLNKKRNGL